MSTGVYSIMHIGSRRRYIGSTGKCFGQRFMQHRVDLRRNDHACQHLQSAWNKYGEKSFRFRVLKYCDAAEVLKWEQFFIEKYQAFDRKRGYNANPVAGTSLGHKWTDEQRAHHSKRKKGTPCSPETRRKIALAKTGLPMTAEHRAAMIAARKNSPIIKAMLTKRNQSAAMRALTRARNKDPKVAAIRLAGYFKWRATLR